MSSSTETTYYMELQPGDAVQDGDQWLDSLGRWQPYRLTRDAYNVSDGVKARRPIGTAKQTVYEEVPGTRTLQQAVEHPQRERIAYEELQTGDVIEAGDQWQNSDGRWQAIVLIPGASAQVRDSTRARRPHNITALQKERDNALTAVKSAQRARDELQRQVDELRTGLMGVVSAEHVHSMLEDMLDQTEWVGQCLDSSTYEQMSCIQRTIANVAERVRNMVKEGASADA